MQLSSHSYHWHSTKRVVASIVVVVLVAMGGYLAIRSFSLSAEPLLEPDDMETVTVGHRVYDVQCAACHGRNFEGQPDWMQRDEAGFLPAPPHDASGHTWHHSDAILFEITKYGLGQFVGADYKTRMPAFDGVLPDEAIRQALSYIKSRWPEEIRERNSLINENAAAASSVDR